MEYMRHLYYLLWMQLLVRLKEIFSWPLLQVLLQHGMRLILLQFSSCIFFFLGLLFFWTFDAVSFNGGIGSLFIDTIGHTFSQKDHNRVIQHEAGHFLIAYLVGILSSGYTLSSLEAFKKGRIP